MFIRIVFITLNMALYQEHEIFGPQSLTLFLIFYILFLIFWEIPFSQFSFCHI